MSLSVYLELIERNLFPLGPGLASGMQERDFGVLTAVTLVLGAGLSRSLMVETLQLLLPSRFPSFKDVIVNSARTVLGFLCFRDVESKFWPHFNSYGYSFWDFLGSQERKHFQIRYRFHDRRLFLSHPHYHRHFLLGRAGGYETKTES